jgi:alpha-galactosidase
MTSTTDQSQAPIRVLNGGGVTVVVDVSHGLPSVLYWGPELQVAAADDGFLRSLAESQQGADGLTGRRRIPAVLPEQSTGWMGTPGLEGHRNGRLFSTKFGPGRVTASGGPGRSQALVSEALDEVARLAARVTVELAITGVLRVKAELTNTAEDESYTVDSMRLVLPVPAEAQEILDFAGRHLRERAPQREPFHVGTHLREGRRGRTGSDATLLLAAGTAGFGFHQGQVWAVHTAWSGNHATFAELGLAGVRILGGGEVLLPGEVVLGAGEAYATPWFYGVYGEGLDDVSAKLHQHLRSRPRHPTAARPVVLNTWEAVYFEQDLDSLVHLAKLGAQVGVERFVLDDGWFHGRRDDSAGLGDWRVDAAVWPQGLGPLVESVRDMGMQFGLWFEPEMVSSDSDLARAHPEWILAPGDRLPLMGRNQHVLNLALPAAFDYLLESMSVLISEYKIDYVKWDHNRDLVEAGDRTTGQARVHQQTLAAYRLMDELRRRHPRLEIESCSSGGGRVDLEVLERTDRVWASDCIDALERQRIQRWTGLVLPPELVGSHVGAPTAHTTRRTQSLAFRAATALFGHFGIEWDLRSVPADALTELAAWVALYKEERTLIHSGTFVRSDYPDPAYWAHGVVSRDRRRALFMFASLDTSLAAQPGWIRLPGLAPDLSYRIDPVHLSEPALVDTRGGPPTWWTDPTTASGGLLEAVGLQGPMLYPEQALVFRLLADDTVERKAQ